MSFVKISAIIAILIIQHSCENAKNNQSQKSAIFINNNSLNDEKINLKVYLDNKLIFSESSINGITIREKDFKIGLHKLHVFESNFILKMDTTVLFTEYNMPILLKVNYDYMPNIDTAYSIYLNKFLKWKNGDEDSLKLVFNNSFSLKKSNYIEIPRSISVKIIKRTFNIE